jgi:hypothetical protein
MARPNKQGVDYFPLDVHLDDKFKFIEIKYKLEGFAVLVKLLQKIYSCGYWYRWTNDEALLFSDEIRCDFALVSDVVIECLERDVFDKSLYEKYSILTSKGIQKRYKEIVRRRKDVEVTEEYLLIDGMQSVNDGIMTASSKHNDGKSTQRKGKERKQKRNKDNSAHSNEFEQFWALYPRKIDKKKAETKFNAAIKKCSFEDILNGTKKYADQVKDTEKTYIKHPSTFLNNESFLDGFEESVEKPSKVIQFDEKTKQKIELQKRLQVVADEMDISWTNKEKFAKLEKEFDQIKEELKQFG